MVVEATLCHVISGRRLLLKKATRGISVGKWNGPGGKIESGETPGTSVVREVEEETGLDIKDPLYHGVMEFYMKGGYELSIRVHLFSARRFTGSPRSTDEGEVRWFAVDRLPSAKMWDDDAYWINAMLLGMRFDAKFYYDEEDSKVVRFEMRSR
jgi:8-oxo-dGTP diphosphatase